MRPLRLLILNSARRWIGEAAHTVALASGLGARGHEVTVAVRRGFEFERHVREAGLRVLPLAMNSRMNPADDWRDVAVLRRLIQSGRIDFMHANRGKDHWIAAMAKMATRPRVPLVRTRHVVTPMRQHLANRWLYRHATDGVLSVSGAAHASFGSLATLVARANGEDAEAARAGTSPTARVVLSSVDSERFHPRERRSETRRSLGVDEEAILVGLVGRIQRIKGHRYFLEAAARMARRYPKARFLLAGRGADDQVRELREFAEAAGLERESLLTLGVVENLPEVMAAFDIGVVASIGSEGSSRVTLEYMASGVAVVATRVGGIPELLEDGVTGFLVDPRDSGALERRMSLLAEDPEIRAAMGGAGRRSSVERFSPERWLDEMEDFYEAARLAHRRRTGD